MALIMYLEKVPRYQNIMTDEYETIPRDDIVLIEKYFNWKKAKEDGKDSGSTLEEWCGIPESRLPHKYIVNYYGDFYTPKHKYNEYAGEIEAYGLFEHLARFVKVNHIFNWFINNVMNGNIDKTFYEVTKMQLEDLLNVCNKVTNGFIKNGDEYVVNEDIAKDVLPILENKGYFFGTDIYGTIYAKQVIEVANAVKKILATTDFEKETVYFNASW